MTTPEREEFERFYKDVLCFENGMPKELLSVYETASLSWQARQPEIDALKAENIRLAGVIDNLKEHLDRKDADVYALKAEIGLCQGTTESRERNIDALKSTIDDLALQNGILKAEIGRLTDERDALKAELKSEQGLSGMGKSFHDLVVKERDYERLQVQRLKAEVSLSQSSERKAAENNVKLADENRRLKAALADKGE